MRFSLITTVIPTFQRPQLLKRAIESVQNQTISPLTILVSDSASQDETEEMVREIGKKDPRVFYYRHPSPITAVQNFEFGLQWVKTPFFSFLADDDLLLPSFYEKGLSLLEKYPQAEFFLGSTLDAFLNGKPISAQALHWPDKEFFLPAEGLPLAIRYYFNWTGALFRTKTAQAHSINPNVVPGDYDYILHHAARYPFTFSSSPCAVFTHHAGSFSNHCGLKLIYPSLPLIAHSICNLRPPIETASLKQLFHRAFLRKSLQIAIQNLKKKNFAEIDSLREALQTEYPSLAGKMLSSLLWILTRFSLGRISFLTAFSFYRWLKSSRVKSYLKNP